MVSIIEQLKKQRKEMKMRQTELGKKLGLPQSHISKIEREETDPRFSTIQDMARILDHELMLVPRQLIPFVNSMLRGGDTYEPRWKLDGVEDGERQLHINASSGKIIVIQWINSKQKCIIAV